MRPGLSLWHDTAAKQPRRPALAESTTVDVAIVGGGLTGLWTAYYLLRADPTLRVLVIEQEHVGFGASGRNGGWCSALFPTSWDRLVRAGGRDGAQAMHAAMCDTVDEVGRVCATEGIEADFAKGGTVVLARSAVQWQRSQDDVRVAKERGLGGLELLGPDEAQGLVAATNVLGGTYTPHCAAVHPARLVQGLAAVVERLGGRIVEGTAATAIEPRRVTTTHGTVSADVVVRATEGFTTRLDRRAIAPVYSLMVATEPLPESIWDEIGMETRPTFSDGRHVIIYGQRTADGRLAFGGRGAPYHFASRISPDFDNDPRVFSMLSDTLRELFPVLGETRLSHHWGGPLGIARDWAASVGLDRATGLAWAGGYVGDGVSTTNLSGRTLTDLIMGNDSDLVRLPWVNHRSRRWEPEPLRWLGINAGLRAMLLADLEEERRGKPSVIAKAMAPLMHG